MDAEQANQESLKSIAESLKEIAASLKSIDDSLRKPQEPESGWASKQKDRIPPEAFKKG